MHRRLCVVSAAALALSACATVPAVQSTTAMATNHSAADLAGIDRAITDVYAVISGPAGQARDFARMRTLFTPDARLSAITPNGLSGGTVDDYIKRSGATLVASGFTESELDRRVEIYGNLAHAWSSYRGTFTGADGSPEEVRGINSFQLVRQGDGRWLVQSILWQAETPQAPLPEDMDGN